MRSWRDPPAGCHRLLSCALASGRNGQLSPPDGRVPLVATRARKGSRIGSQNRAKSEIWQFPVLSGPSLVDPAGLDHSVEEFPAEPVAGGPGGRWYIGGVPLSRPGR